MATNTAPNQTTNPDNEFEEVPDTYAEPWKEPKKGDSIVGEYVGARSIKGDRGDFFDAHVLIKDDGSLISVAGGSIDARMARVPYGTRVKVTFDGMQKHKGNNMKLFTVVCAKGTKLKPITFTKTKETDDSNIPF